jgi:AcrR family transcriptional regulator
VASITKKTPRRLSGESDPAETQTKILDAAFRQLATKGYASLSMREIAKDAGVNHALINYYFRSKDQLVIAVLDEANRQLLERQQKMYAAPSTFAE